MRAGLRDNAGRNVMYSCTIHMTSSFDATYMQMMMSMQGRLKLCHNLTTCTRRSANNGIKRIQRLKLSPLNQK